MYVPKDKQPELVRDRVQVYGDPADTFIRIAQMWTAILDHDVWPHDVALMMAAMKMIRATQAPRYADNIDDIEGYMDIYRRIIGEDMVEAKSVGEYLDKVHTLWQEKVEDDG